MLNERMPGDLCVTQPSLFLSAKSSNNKTVLAAIFLDMHTSAKLLLVSFSVHSFKSLFPNCLHRRERQTVQFRHPSIISASSPFSLDIVQQEFASA
jgi:hypothetical protein